MTHPNTALSAVDQSFSHIKEGMVRGDEFGMHVNRFLSQRDRVPWSTADRTNRARACLSDRNVFRYPLHTEDGCDPLIFRGPRAGDPHCCEQTDIFLMHNLCCLSVWRAACFAAHAPGEQDVQDVGVVVRSKELRAMKEYLLRLYGDIQITHTGRRRTYALRDGDDVVVERVSLFDEEMVSVFAGYRYGRDDVERSFAAMFHLDRSFLNSTCCFPHLYLRGEEGGEMVAFMADASEVVGTVRNRRKTVLRVVIHASYHQTPSVWSLLRRAGALWITVGESAVVAATDCIDLDMMDPDNRQVSVSGAGTTILDGLRVEGYKTINFGCSLCTLNGSEPLAVTIERWITGMATTIVACVSARHVFFFIHNLHVACKLVSTEKLMNEARRALLEWHDPPEIAEVIGETNFRRNIVFQGRLLCVDVSYDTWVSEEQQERVRRYKIMVYNTA